MGHCRRSIHILSDYLYHVCISILHYILLVLLLTIYGYDIELLLVPGTVSEPPESHEVT